MNKPDLKEVIEKIERVRRYLDENVYDAMIIGRQDNFAWLTDGGNNRVVIPSELGFSLVVITKSNVFLIAQVMDGMRVMDEELEGLNFEYVPLHWYEGSREEKAVELVSGGKAVSDIPIAGVSFLPKNIYNLHYPLTVKEIQKLRWLGEKTEETIAKVAQEIKPGMTEYEIEAMFLYEYGKLNIYPDVLLIGSDERILKYRHPNPSEKKVDKYILLHPAVRKWGLHANVTRLMYFGDNIPDDIAKKYDAVNQIQAAAVSMCETGTRFSDILVEQKKLYKNLGYEDEWRNHYQGGITGYMVAVVALSDNQNNVVQNNQAYDWFVTITGAKVEELSINSGKSQEFLSVTGKWPTKEYGYNGKKFMLPSILMR